MAASEAGSKGGAVVHQWDAGLETGHEKIGSRYAYGDLLEACGMKRAKAKYSEPLTFFLAM